MVIVIAAWTIDTAFYQLLHPRDSFLNLLIFDIPLEELAERSFHVTLVTICFLLAWKIFFWRRRSKEARWEGERLLDTLFHSIQEGLIIKDNDFNIIRVNSVAAQWFAYAMPLVGKKCYEALKGRSQPCEACPTRLALETGNASNQVVPKPGPGGAQVGWLDLYAYPLFDRTSGKATGVVEFARDITQRKQAEEALRETETRYRLLVNNIPAVVFKGYADWTIDFVDDKIEELTGYQKEEFDSRRMNWRDVILEEDLKDVKNVFVQALKTGKPYVREYRIRRQDGGILWIQARGQIVCDLQGKIEYVSGVFFDITAQKQVEQEVERLASFPQLNPDPVLEVDSAGTLTYYNAAATKALEKLGVSEGEKLFLPPDLGEILKDANETDEKNFYREVQIKDAVFGERIEFIPQFDVVRIRAADITRRKKTEEALRRSEASLAEAQRLAHLGNWEWDIRTGEAFWSDEVYRILGVGLREIPATFKAFLRTVHPEDRELVRGALGNALHRGRPFGIGYSIMRPDGSERFVYGQGEVSLDERGRPARMLGTIQDVTERRRAQEALKESEKRYRLLAENVTDVIWTTDLNLHLTYVSPSIQLLTGHTPQEYLSLGLEQLLPRTSMELVRKRLQEELALEEENPDPSRSMMAEIELFRQDGSTVWTEVKASFLREAQSRPMGILGITRDITRRRKLEEQLQQSQKMEMVGRLAGGVAHDFNNLLTAILGYCELLLSGLPAGNPAHQDVGEIKKAGERAALLTRQLLAFSRRQMLRPKSLDLNQVVENLGKMLKRVIGEDIELAIVPGPGLGRVMADPGQIEQVILNLTVNARDAMLQGGKLILTTANVDLDEAYAAVHAQVQPGPYVLLSVIDTGCGMDPATRSHIFEPFFTTKEVGKGTGLGLATVYGIIRQSGGHIWVYSEPGRGTAFKIYLPRIDAGKVTAGQNRVSRAALQGTETILLVEDENLVRQVARRILQNSGYTVLEAKDGNEALEIFQEHRGPIHLMLTDMVMPGLGGPELASRLTSRYPELKVLFMSGYADKGGMDKDPTGQGLVCLQKPFKAHALTQKVRETLDAPLAHLPPAAPPAPPLRTGV